MIGVIGVIGVILSGALDDGTAGLWAIKDRGGLAYVQDPAEAMHDSMPESAIQHVEIDLVGSTAMLAEALSAVIGGTVLERPENNAKSRHANEIIIAEKGNELEAGVMEMGKVFKYTCPDCHGVLVKIQEGSILRFRCHTGHAYSLKTLICEINDAIDSGLWDTLRAVEERILLLREMAEQTASVGASDDATACMKQAEESAKCLQALRDLVSHLYSEICFRKGLFARLIINYFQDAFGHEKGCRSISRLVRVSPPAPFVCICKKC